MYMIIVFMIVKDFSSTSLVFTGVEALMLTSSQLQWEKTNHKTFNRIQFDK